MLKDNAKCKIYISKKPNEIIVIVSQDVENALKELRTAEKRFLNVVKDNIRLLTDYEIEE